MHSQLQPWRQDPTSTEDGNELKSLCFTNKTNLHRWIGSNYISIYSKDGLEITSLIHQPFSLTKPSCSSHVSGKMMTWMWYVWGSKESRTQENSGGWGREGPMELNWLWFLSGEGKGSPLQYFCLENPKDRGAWKAAVHGVTKSRTPLSDFTFTFHFHALEKKMATHSSVLAWRILGTAEPGAAIYGIAQSQTRLKRLSSNSSSWFLSKMAQAGSSNDFESNVP